ncbi:MAG: FAD-dependent oxidoreductase [Firmicutes bacterium]|nr:FAD-dependent oxidoreductase [Bacillota bacterium]
MTGELYDLIIIGAGPAGMTAAVYCLRKGLRTMVLSKDIGGQANWTTLVENYMGFMEISGPELMQRFEDQLKKEKANLVNDEAVDLVQHGGAFTVKGKTTGEHRGRAVIVATGKRPKKLGVQGEEQFKGKGVSYCSTCDAPLFRETAVAVVGGGNSGVQAVLDLLANQARQIFLVTNQELTADQVLVKQIIDHPKVRLYLHSQVTEIHGEQMITAVSVQSQKTGLKEQLPVEGVFVEIGLEPNSEFLQVLRKNNLGEVVIDCECRTNLPGVFAAGDVTNIPEKQIIVACGEGAKAAIKAWEYLTHSGERKVEAE